MNIVCVGGGPAGLYFAILMKKADPSHRITVLERNAPGETFGWGVVFSDETLGYLAENDTPTHEAITRGFAHWDAIDIHHKGEVVRSGGHGFSGIARRDLLRILQARCEELGVELVFRTEVEPDDPRLRGADLVLAGDGVNSKIRKAHEAVFRPSLDVRHARYMWLGTRKRFDAFTFLFEENEHGVFQVHAYRFDEDTSTFIVECDEASWRAAGLDRATAEESVAYLEKVFARHLEGEKLLTNKSSWIQFTTVKNATWRHGRTVLVGDAAHTAHFSIGSGTKLAMEDSIALAKALQREPDVDRALEIYETERRPTVERIQKAAQDSLEWFENTKRYVPFEPVPFAFSLLTRSKRITYENLKKRDPALIDRVRDDFASRAGARRVSATPSVPPPGRVPGASSSVITAAPSRQAATAPAATSVTSTPLAMSSSDVPPPVSPSPEFPPPMFVPFLARGVTLANRVVVSPMCMYSSVDGAPNDFHLVHLGSRAMGGAGLVFTEMTAVAADGRITPGCAGMYDDAHVVGWKRVVDFVHARTGSKVALQLGHAGRKGSTCIPWECAGDDVPLVDGAWPLLAPSALPYLPTGAVPRAMTREDMARVKRDFVRATERAVEAGFDWLELHAAHGYLLSSFVTPLSNRREDDYGGSLENRLRFPLEVFEAIRATWPKDRPMSVRMSATDWVPGGFEGADAVRFARALKERGCDVIDVSSGQTSPEASPVYGRMFQAKFSDQIRNEAGVPTIAVGNIVDADQVNTLVASRRADLCAIARTHLREPYFTHHAAEHYGFVDLAWPPQYRSVKPRPIG